MPRPPVNLKNKENPKFSKFSKTPSIEMEPGFGARPKPKAPGGFIPSEPKVGGLLVRGPILPFRHGSAGPSGESKQKQGLALYVACSHGFLSMMIC